MAITYAYGVTDSRGKHFDIADNSETKKYWFAVLDPRDNFPDPCYGSFDFVEAVRKAAKEINCEDLDVKIGIFDQEDGFALRDIGNGKSVVELNQDDILDYMTLIKELIAKG